MRTLVIAALFCCCCSIVFAQEHALDRYLNRSPVLTTIASAADNVSAPQDLDFCRQPGREHELWVINRGDANGGTVVIVYDAGKPTQKTEFRHDSHAGHFMVYPTAIAMGDNGNFGTTGEILNTNGHPTSTFMGPTLWTTDTSVFARANQNNWVQGELLGSHSDMLHESPFSMSIAADTGNVYWVFSGYYNAIMRFDFAEPHGYGEDDHSDGLVLQYDVPVKRVSAMPSHMVLDQASGWLYAIDNGNKRIIRLQTRSGEMGDELPMENETLVEYREVVNSVWETIDSNITRLCGIDLMDGRLIASVNPTGEIRVYNTTTAMPTYMGSINTGEPGIMGVKIGPDSAIWYVNKTKKKVVRLTPGEPSAVADAQGKEEFGVYPNPAQSEIVIPGSDRAESIAIVNSLGVTVRTVAGTTLSGSVDIRDLPNGVYYCLVHSKGSISTTSFVVSR